MGFSLAGMLDLMIPIIIIGFFVRMIQDMAGSFGVGSMLSTSMILRDRRKNKVQNDGTDRDYLSLVKSCKAVKTQARRLILDPGEDKDLSIRTVGRILGISPRMNFTAFYVRSRAFKRFLILAPTELTSTLDRPDVRIRGRTIVNYAEIFWFVEPQRGSKYFKKIDDYWRMCNSWLDEVGKKRLSIDNKGDTDCQTKSAMRREEEKNALREIQNIQPKGMDRYEHEMDED